MWKEENNTLYKKFEFKDFVEAFDFMTKVAAEAEEAQHHPTWKNTYNKVEIWLNTHDAGDIVTDKDRHLAKAIDNLAG
jgi:4a-hydroxytetrahydrobiopterin dehydratase